MNRDTIIRLFVYKLLRIHAEEELKIGWYT